MRVYTSVTQLIGRTPLLELVNYNEAHGLNARVFAKLELFNPAGSAKDRVAAGMIADAEKRGLLKKGATIIEPTSGNTGIGLACVAAARGYKTILTMPETMSPERQKLLKAYGAEVVLTDGAKGMKGAIEKAEQLAAELPGSFIPSQFDNPANPKAHFDSTGPEIWEDTDGGVDIFVAGIGTGGTLSGTGTYLKSMNRYISVVGFEPDKSPLITKGSAGAHSLQGIGANFIPKNYDASVADEVLTITKDEAYTAVKALAHLEGILVGITSGAAVAAASRLANRPENAGKTIVALLPDTGERYLSTGVFD